MPLTVEKQLNKQQKFNEKKYRNTHYINFIF